MISKMYLCECENNNDFIIRKYYKCYKFFKLTIFKKEIDFYEWLFKGDKYVN